MSRRPALALLLALTIVLGGVSACVHHEHRRDDSTHVRVRAPFTHVDVDVPKHHHHHDDDDDD